MPMPFTAEYLMSIFLVFVRVGGLLITAPFFRQSFISVRVKVLLAVLLAYVMAGFAGGPLPEHVFEPLGLSVAVGVEAVTGLVLGFAAQFIFWAVQFAGEILGFQMALSLAQIFDPASGTSANPLSRFLTLSFLLVFLLIDGHHQLLRGLAASFEVVPLAGAHLAQSGPLLLEWTGTFFATALRLAAPFMMTIFLIDVSLGIFARMVPQADLFSLSLPLKLIFGISLFYVFLHRFLAYAPSLVEEAIRFLTRMAEALAA